MKKDDERISLQSLLSIPQDNNKIEACEITNDISILTYLYNPNNNRTCLLLEGIENGQRLCKIAEFVIKENTDNTKGAIRFVDTNVKELQTLSEDCVGWAYDLKMDQTKSFINLLEAEIQRGKAGLINYIAKAGSRLGPSVGSGLDASGSHELLTASETSIRQILKKLPQEYSNKLLSKASQYIAESLISLLVQGHNSQSWPKAILSVMNIPNSRLKKIFMNPAEIPPSPDHGCRIF